MKISKNFLPNHFHYLEGQFRLARLFEYGITENFLKGKQVGGAKIFKKEYQFVEKNGVYTFLVQIEREKESNRHNISVISDDELECITVFIYKEFNVAILHNMSYFEGCAKEGLRKPGGGTILLKFILNFLTQNKDEFEINKIALTDYSFLNCPSCRDTIKLSRLRLITKGKTWYQSYGFLPVDPDKYTLNKGLDFAIQNNNRIISKMKTNDINLSNVVKKMDKKERQGIDLKELQRIIKKYPMLREFVIRLQKEFVKYCCLLFHITNELYVPSLGKNPVLVDVFKTSFYLPL